MYVVANEDSKGNGLGLYVVKRTVDVLNGSVFWDSEVNKGSKFKIIIPIVPTEALHSTPLIE